MGRSFEITLSPTGWVLKVYQDGEEVAAGKAGSTDEDYDYLLEQAQSICAEH